MVDGRFKRTSTLVVPHCNTSEWVPKETAVSSTMESNLNPPIEEFLLDYYTFYVLPSLMNGQAHPRYWDFSYTYLLARDSPSFSAAARACGAFFLFTTDGSSQARDLAIAYSAKASRCLRKAIENHECVGDEDWLLGAVTALGQLEIRKLDSSPSSWRAHMAAAAQIFRLRRKGQAHNQSTGSVKAEASLTFERRCMEMFLANSLVLVMDSDYLGSLLKTEVKDSLDMYFEHTTLPVHGDPANWPILNISYKLCCVVVNLTTIISRFPRYEVFYNEYLVEVLRNIEILEAAEAADHFTHLLEGAIRQSTARHHTLSTAFLYLQAAKVLIFRLLHHESVYLRDHKLEVFESIARCMRLAQKLHATGYNFNRYFIWPLLVLRFGSEYHEDEMFLDSLLERLYRNDSMSSYMAKQMEKKLRMVFI